MMNPKVEELYNRLFSFESSSRQKPYPIHKKLLLEDQGVDLIDWLASKIGFTAGMTVLDAGCGCGDTIFKLLPKGIRAIGVSISSKEISFARDYALRSGVSEYTQFIHGSYDQVYPESFDVIIAIESLKHSPNPLSTLQNLISHLTSSNSQLVIADDFFHQKGAVKSMQDSLWLSEQSLIYQEFISAIEHSGGYVAQNYDLTKRVPIRNKLLLKLLIGLISPLHFISKHMGLSIYLGGLLLEKAYSDQKCGYHVLVVKKSDSLY